MKPEKRNNCITFNGRRVVFDLSVYKQLGFYQLLDPEGPRAYGYHVYGATMKIFLGITQTAVVIGALSVFAKNTAPNVSVRDKLNSFETIVILTNCTMASLKLYTIVSNADVIWKLLDVAYVDCLQCPGRDARIITDLAENCELSTAIIKLITRCFLAGLMLWAIAPFFINRYPGAERQLQPSGPYDHVQTRQANIFNIPFPATVTVYNKYYFLFYFIEMSMAFCIFYGSLLLDVCLMSICWIISMQYQSVATSFTIFGHDRLISTPADGDF